MNFIQSDRIDRLVPCLLSLHDVVIRFSDIFLEASQKMERGGDLMQEKNESKITNAETVCTFSG